MLKLSRRKQAFNCLLIALNFLGFNVLHSSAQITRQDTISLTLSQAEQHFLQQNLSLLAAHYNVEANRALIAQAKLWDNPVLTTDQNVFADRKFFSHGKNANGQTEGQIYVQVQQLIRTAGKRSKQVALATSSAQLSELRLQEVLRSLKYQLRTNYFTIAQLYAIQEIYNREQTEMERLLAGMEAELKAGNIAQKDYLRVQALVIALQQDLTENRRNISNAEAELKTLIQVSGNMILKPVDTLAFLNFSIPPLNEVIDSAKSNNPAYLIQQKQITYQEQNLQYQKAPKTPDVTLGPEYDRVNSYAPNYIGLTISLPLPLFNKNQGNIKAAEFSVKQEQTSLKQLETELSNNVVNAYNKLLFSQQQNSTTQIEFYNNYRKMFRNMLQSYQQRQISLLEFIDFFDAFKEANIRAQQQQLNLQLAKEELNFQAGTNLIR